MRARPPPLIYSDTDRSADALYFGRVPVPDPFIAFAVRGRKYAVVSALEFGRIRRESDFDTVLPLESCLLRAGKAWPGRRIGAAEVILLLSREMGQRSFTVGEDFPAGLYARLLRLGLRPKIAQGALFPRREIKTPAEARAIREGNRCSAAGIAAAERILRGSRIRAGRLLYEGRILTSERLRTAVEMACVAEGSTSANTIVAGGDQACDPHHRGSGPLRPGELIIVDVFPRVNATGYFGDMTRTFLRGRAGDAQHRLVAAVRAAQLAALKAIRAGVAGKAVHAEVTSVFSRLGFETRTGGKGSCGFFHGTGHGLGLAVHEPPRLNRTATLPLKSGAVVTVEPGLYYPGLGGCRIEDVVQVTQAKPRLLSNFHYEWNLR